MSATAYCWEYAQVLSTICISRITRNRSSSLCTTALPFFLCRKPVTEGHLGWDILQKEYFLVCGKKVLFTRKLHHFISHGTPKMAPLVGVGRRELYLYLNPIGLKVGVQRILSTTSFKNHKKFLFINTEREGQQWRCRKWVMYYWRMVKQLLFGTLSFSSTCLDWHDIMT